MSNSTRTQVESLIAEMVADGTTRQVQGPKGHAAIVPFDTYTELLADAMSWRRLQAISPETAARAQETPALDSYDDMPDADTLALLAFGTPDGMDKPR